MQDTYRSIVGQAEKYSDLYSQLVHSDWQAKSKELKKYLLGEVCNNFLLHPILKGSMVRKYQSVNPELRYLLDSASSKSRQLFLDFQEVYVGGLVKSVHDINCSGNSLSAMYYLARAIDYYEKPLETIVEFGGGFGSMACLAKTTMPLVTYIIFDLPEIVAIQSLYLRKILPDQVKVHYQAPTEFLKGYIHLVPVHLMNEVKISHANLFISTFAITESTLFAQNAVASVNNFFNAEMCYIVGLASSPKWVDTKPLIKSINERFKTVKNEPYLNNHIFYELRAKRS